MTAEHIIPEGLGGKDVIPKASCDACRCITSKFEGRVLRGNMLPARAHYGIFGKRRAEKRPKTLPVIYRDANGNDEVVEVPIKQHPFQMMMPQLPNAGYIIDQPRDTPYTNIDIKRHVYGIPESYERSNKLSNDDPQKRAIIVPTGIDIVSFYRMLAKIAHCYTTVGMEYRPFTPFLRDIILGRADNDGPFFVGGALSAEGLPITALHRSEDELHTLKAHLLLTDDDSRTTFVTRIQLISPMQLPAYECYTGEPLKMDRTNDTR